MPYVYLYQCPRCKFEVEIVLGREFERRADGSRLDYQYPAPDLYEWPPRRVSGLWSRLWCPACRALRTHVLVELDPPAEHPVQVFLAAEAQGLHGAETGACTCCGTPLAYDLEESPCPTCPNGRFTCLGEYEP